MSNLDAPARNPTELVQSGLPVVRMDRSDRQHLRMLRCQRDQRVVLRPSVLDVSLQRLAGPAKPHAAKCGDLPLRGRDLGLILVDRLCTIAQVNVQVERGILRGRRMGQEQQQSCQGGNPHQHRLHSLPIKMHAPRSISAN